MDKVIEAYEALEERLRSLIRGLVRDSSLADAVLRACDLRGEYELDLNYIVPAYLSEEDRERLEQTHEHFCIERAKAKQLKLLEEGNGYILQDPARSLGYNLDEMFELACTEDCPYKDECCLEELSEELEAYEKEGTTLDYEDAIEREFQSTKLYFDGIRKEQDAMLERWW